MNDSLSKEERGITLFVSSQSALVTNKALYKHQSKNFYFFSTDFKHAEKKWGFYYLFFTKGKIQCSLLCTVQSRVNLLFLLLTTQGSCRQSAQLQQQGFFTALQNSLSGQRQKTELNSSSLWVEPLQLSKGISMQHYHFAFGKKNIYALAMSLVHYPFASHTSTLGFIKGQCSSKQLQLELNTTGICCIVTKVQVPQEFWISF